MSLFVEIPSACVGADLSSDVSKFLCFLRAGRLATVFGRLLGLGWDGMNRSALRFGNAVANRAACLFAWLGIYSFMDVLFCRVLRLLLFSSLVNFFHIVISLHFDAAAANPEAKAFLSIPDTFAGKSDPEIASLYDL